MSEPILELDKVSRTFETAAGLVVALSPLSLTVQRGERVAIRGRSGSGKTTLLNLLGLLDRPSTGEYRLHSVATTTLRESARIRLRSRSIGFVFQEFQLLTDRTVAENVALGSFYQRSSAPRPDPYQLLDQVGLGHRGDAYPATLSGGEKQRVAIARAVATRAEILLCDEPTGNLDPETGSLIMDLLDSLDKTILVVTHSPQIADRFQRSVTIDAAE